MSSVRTATVTPARRLQGRIRVPGDKSISHRYALLAALSEGRSELRNYAPGADCRSTLDCLAALGVDVATAGDTITLMGRGLRSFRSPGSPLDAGNSGTTMRMLTGVLAGQPFDSELIGDASLSRRPMRRVIEPLSSMGASIDATDGHAPLTVHGRPLHAHPLHADGSQRPGEERHPPGWPAHRWHHLRHRTGANTRSHRTGPGGVWIRRRDRTA